ncbi:MAG: gamma-glutamyl-gamma-aminobutyrate hydrolase family protein [Alphaproteobacteria bacterium]|nr:gamma-glutamyl-gamma-aminobutyrate hydrolase family protein [Alphaproteobacteria bacterium]
MRRPVVGLTADCRDIGGQPMHVLGDKYARAIADIAGATPLIVPAMADTQDVRQLVGLLDGVVLTGSPSNVHPARYGSQPGPRFEPYDEARDAVVFALVDRALESGLPTLGLCRGFQEINVARGGSLVPEIHAIEGCLDHRRPDGDDRDIQYGPKHAVRFAPGSRFEDIAGGPEIMVNSVHAQGLDQLGDGIVIEGWAPDGTPEALRVDGVAGFALAVQWHPEYKAMENDFSRRLFAAFGDAVRSR